MDRLEKLLKMLEEQPGDSFLLFAIALEYVKLGNDATALEYFNKILQNEPGYEGLYYHLGKLYERKNDLEKAREIYTAGLSITKALNPKANNELRAALDEITEE